MESAFHESTPLTKEDCLLVFTREKKAFEFPVHFHSEYELNFIKSAKGSQRIIGCKSFEIADFELVLLGPNVLHGWTYHNTFPEPITEITIQFYRELFSTDILQKKAFTHIQNLLALSSQGISFSQEVIEKVLPLLYEIKEQEGVYAYITLLKILEELSTNKFDLLSDTSVLPFNHKKNLTINTMYSYIEENFRTKITLSDIASHLHMTEISFSRLIKQRTGKTFVDFLNDYRIQHAQILLHETDKPIIEIAEECGFHNQSNFNRIFKQKLNISPRDFKLSKEHTTKII